MQILYDELGPLYDKITSPLVDTEREAAFLDQVFQTRSVNSVLDIACGTGRHVIALAKRGFTATGIDYSAKLLQVAKDNAAQLPNASFSQQDVNALDLHQRFDAAICMWSTFGELPYQQLLAQLPSILLPNGIFIIDTTHYDAIPTDPSENTASVENDGSIITIHMKNHYQGRTRLRDVTYNLPNKTLTDHSRMDIYTVNELNTLLQQHGLSNISTYYDYSFPSAVTTGQRVQLVYTLHDS